MQDIVTRYYTILRLALQKGPKNSYVGFILVKRP
jgi:hypothetical protein